MDDRTEAETAISFPQWVHNLPFLSEFGNPLPRLREPATADLDATFARLGEILGTPSAPLALRIQIRDGEQVRSWLLDAGPMGCRVTTDADRSPNVEAILDADTWALIASGRMSPLEAFGRNRMRVRGDLQAARRLARQLYRKDAAQP